MALPLVVEEALIGCVMTWGKLAHNPAFIRVYMQLVSYSQQTTSRAWRACTTDMCSGLCRSIGRRSRLLSLQHSCQKCCTSLSNTGEGCSHAERAEMRGLQET